VRVAELFNIHQGNGLELINMDIDKGSTINFVARTSENNGVVARVSPIDKEPFPIGAISVAVGGSVLSSFVQNELFYTGFHVLVLIPKSEMRLEEKLFYCHAIKMNAYRYSYGRQANKTLKDINLPPLPKCLKNYEIDYSVIDTKIKHKDIPFDANSWGKFKMDDIFIFRKGKRLTKEDMVDGNINFIGAIDNNNGIRQKIGLPPTHSGNCITVNYNGSVGEAFYQSEPFLASDDVNILYPKNWKLNQYIGLFLCTIIRTNKYRFGYGRKWKLERMRETVIALPVDGKGAPDWRYMENYIKKLPYSDLI
jgi:restriction endonuclease S subunit